MKRIFRMIGIFALLILAIAIAFAFLIDANQFRPALESRLTASLGRDVRLGNLKISLFSGAVSAGDLSIADDPSFSKTPFLRAESLDVGVELLPLILSRKLNVTGIAINRPQIHLVETQAGTFNFSTMGSKSTAARVPVQASVAQPTQVPEFSIARIRISDGSVAFEKTGARNRPLQLDHLNIDVKNFAPRSQFPFSLTAGLPGNGTIDLQGTAGPISQGAADQTPFQAKLKVTHLDLVPSGLLNPADGIGGIASVDGSAESANGSIDITGKLGAERLILAKGGKPASRPVQVDLLVSHSLTKQSGEVRRMTIHLGKASANLRGTYRTDEEPAAVNLTLTGSGMPLVELATFLPALNIALPSGSSIDQGTANLNLTAGGSLSNLVTRGTLSAEHARLANYDFASKLQVLHEFTGVKAQPHTTIEILSTNLLNTAGEGTALDHLQLVIPSIGTITGSGTISPSHALAFQMRAAAGSGALASLGVKGDIPFLIQGTAENPAIRPDVRGFVSDKLNQFTGGKPNPATDLLRGIFGGKKKR